MEYTAGMRDTRISARLARLLTHTYDDSVSSSMVTIVAGATFAACMLIHERPCEPPGFHTLVHLVTLSVTLWGRSSARIHRVVLYDRAKKGVRMTVAATPSASVPRNAACWAPSLTTLQAPAAPAGAVNLNVDGRPVVGALQGFGQLWQKTYRIRLHGVSATPAEVVHAWKANFPAFQPATSRFYPSVSGIQPGEALLINAR